MIAPQSALTPGTSETAERRPPASARSKDQRAVRSGQALRDALQAVKAQGGLHVWVSHMFVQQDLTGQSTAAGEGLLIQAGSDGAVRVLGVWALAPDTTSR